MRSCFLRRRQLTCGQSSHSLRYVMKNRATDEPLFVVIFKLLPVDSEGKPIETEEADEEKADKPSASNDDELD